MSWDIFVQDIPSDARTIDDIPDDFVPATIGRRAEIIEKIKEIVPFADFSDPAWGTIEGADYSIEVNLGADERIDSFAFHVRGDDVAAGLISDILQHLNLRAFDSGTGDIFDHQKAAAGLKTWRAYRDWVVDRKASATEQDK
ncbi:MAG TPA: hypothetical protein VLQ90_03085 [Pyrinomonadaceae bacterium]|nr:hypothetical protein [Pyrinomonadaceae bacterium]